MMQARLTAARALLKDSGFILVSIDDAELGNLQKMMCDVFGKRITLAIMSGIKTGRMMLNYYPSGMNTWFYAKDKEHLGK